MELPPSLEAEEVRPVDSLHRRYFYKLATGFVGLGLNVVIQAIIPRGLGPRIYGDFSFLSNFFTRLVAFFDTGTSIAFYVKLSQRPRESSLVTFYGYFVGIVSLLIACLLAVCQVTGIWVHIWPGQALGFVYLAAIWGLLSWLVKLFTMMADAYGLTVQSSMASMAQKVVALALIAFLFVSNWLWLTTFFLYHYIIMGFFLVVVALLLRHRGHGIGWQKKLSVSEVRSYLREFFDYSHPLFLYALVGLVAGLLDRWFLQVFGGSVQQGFFGLSYQIGALCFLFSSAMTPLLTREFAIAFESRDLPQIANLFKRYIPLFYAMAAYFACFLAMQADKVIYLMGGKNFQAAQLALTVMVFYPIHQTYGQLSGSVFWAIGDTVRFRNIGITCTLLGLPLSYVLLAPGSMLGLDAGATGLALKMVLLQILTVNVQLYYNTRLLGLRFWSFVSHQVVSVACFLATALLATFLVDHLISLPAGVTIRFLLAGVIYTCLVTVLIFWQPRLLGLSWEDLQALRRQLLKFKK
jgi:O-antigen/teichoic acid export membrane protein